MKNSFKSNNSSRWPTHSRVSTSCRILIHLGNRRLPSETHAETIRFIRKVEAKLIRTLRSWCRLMCPAAAHCTYGKIDGRSNTPPRSKSGPTDRWYELHDPLPNSRPPKTPLAASSHQAAHRRFRTVMRSLWPRCRTCACRWGTVMLQSLKHLALRAWRVRFPIELEWAAKNGQRRQPRF